VIVPDLNLLIHAYNAGSRDHVAARTWWEGCLNGEQPIGLSWTVLLGFLRLTTRAVIQARPLSIAQATAIERAWLARQPVQVLHPGDRHSQILFGLLEHLGVSGNLVTDAHLAALAIEYQAELHSTDTDFARFPGLHWRNPLV